eukprot:scaffold93242_cov48-Attheya_sp.AAC.1
MVVQHEATCAMCNVQCAMCKCKCETNEVRSVHNEHQKSSTCTHERPTFGENGDRVEHALSLTLFLLRSDPERKSAGKRKGVLLDDSGSVHWPQENKRSSTWRLEREKFRPDYFDDRLIHSGIFVR